MCLDANLLTKRSTNMDIKIELIGGPQAGRKVEPANLLVMDGYHCEGHYEYVNGEYHWREGGDEAAQAMADRIEESAIEFNWDGV